MIKLFKKHTTTTAVLFAFSLTGCSGFDTRMQATDDFAYQNMQLAPAYKTGTFSNDEAREQFAVPPLTKVQKKVGYLTKDVDIRPPTQLIPVIDGVQLAAEQQHSKIWFHAFKDENVKSKIWKLLQSYLAENKVEIIAQDDSAQQIETAVYRQKSVYGSFLNRNELITEASYRFTLEEQAAGHSVALSVELLSYSESNNGKDLKFTLADKSSQSIELRFINNLLEYAYNIKQANKADTPAARALAVKLGFDNNEKIAWIAQSSFADTWKNLPDLLTLLHFEIVEADRNRGHFLLDFSAPSDDYWQENNLTAFQLENAEYFIQLGEISADSTSISWLDQIKNLCRIRV